MYTRNSWVFFAKIAQIERSTSAKGLLDLSYTSLMTLSSDAKSRNSSIEEEIMFALNVVKRGNDCRIVWV